VRSNGESFLENGPKVRWESEVEGGFDRGEFRVCEAREDWDVE